MRIDTEVSHDQDKYIQDIIRMISDKYGYCEALRGQWTVRFVYYEDGIKKTAMVKKDVLKYHQEKNKLPETIKNLLK